MNTTDRERLLRIYPVLRELPAALFRKVEETAEPLNLPAMIRLGRKQIEILDRNALNRFHGVEEA